MTGSPCFTPEEVDRVRVVTCKSSIDKFLSPPITPMKARAVKSFPIGKEWMYEPKWDGFRCLVFRDEENIFLQSRTGKSLTSGFPEIVAAFETLSPKRFVLDGELATDKSPCAMASRVFSSHRDPFSWIHGTKETFAGRRRPRCRR